MWDLVYALLQLVANVAAVHYVAPHFSKIWLFVVFMVEPVLRNAIATAGKLTVTNVDDVFYAIVTEVGQFVVYSYFADWGHEARHVFAILCLVKFILTMVATTTTDSELTFPPEGAPERHLHPRRRPRTSASRSCRSPTPVHELRAVPEPGVPVHSPSSSCGSAGWRRRRRAR